ncbi:hypothetical protein HanIR_Chr10g0461401 [Helianthus annuus]|nr:hypothetical protein HanIR_Chr10g0461401 [Helianthus annuus]
MTKKKILSFRVYYIVTSCGKPFQPVRSGEAMGLGLLCRNLSSSVNPWFAIPETLMISEKGKKK